MTCVLIKKVTNNITNYSLTVKLLMSFVYEMSRVKAACEQQRGGDRGGDSVDMCILYEGKGLKYYLSQ